MGDLTLTIVAILGALAWLPQIINWLIQWCTKPCLKIFSDNEAQVGFISFGSVLNINLSFLSKRKGSLIEKIELIVTGQDNSQLDLLWKYYKETFYELNGGENNSVEVGKQTESNCY